MSDEMSMENKEMMNETVKVDTSAFVEAGKTAYSSMGWKMALYALIGTGMQFAYMFLVPVMFGADVVNRPWYSWMLIAIPLYAIAFPILLLLIKNTPKSTIEKHSMKFGKFICCIFMSAAICGVGGMIGTLINLLVVTPFGVASDNSNVLANLMLDSQPFFRILTVGILAPVVEELIFRKLLIDRVVKYGEFVAILTSGLMFGLFHGNFSQAIFAMGLGMFFSFIYIRTGKVGYPILLHMIINLSTSVITVFLTQRLDLEAITKMSAMDPTSAEAQALVFQVLPSLLSYAGWLIFLFICVIVGIIMWCCFAKRMFIKPQECQMPQKGRCKAAYLNAGMILYFVFCIALFVFTYASMIAAA